MAYWAKKHLHEVKEHYEGEFGTQDVVIANLEEQVGWHEKEECIH